MAILSQRQLVRAITPASTGLSTGTCYFIPKQYEAEARRLYQQLDSLAYDFVEHHPEQFYHYAFTSGFSFRSLIDMVRGLNIEGNPDYVLKTVADDKGFYFLSVNTTGELWIPKDWPKLKSYVNGKRTYLKGMKPEKDK